ncbi:12457_t:CDS:2 [Dentiscutata erythropus]|uniref:12457_t:CDS:1 n=1 Tax=Dentiscutata erythropus TaxID=1348616 RepID=A0A9N8VPI8_9GLOM|nr:12457_t:CDS:2 [Dentiscutata erythropus]
MGLPKLTITGYLSLLAIFFFVASVFATAAPEEEKRVAEPEEKREAEPVEKKKRAPKHRKRNALAKHSMYACLILSLDLL